MTPALIALLGGDRDGLPNAGRVCDDEMGPQVHALRRPGCSSRQHDVIANPVCFWFTVQVAIIAMSSNMALPNQARTRDAVIAFRGGTPHGSSSLKFNGPSRKVSALGLTVADGGCWVGSAAGLNEPCCGRGRRYPAPSLEMRLAERERKGLRSMEEYERNRYLLGMKKTDQAKKNGRSTSKAWYRAGE